MVNRIRLNNKTTEVADRYVRHEVIPGSCHASFAEALANPTVRLDNVLIDLVACRAKSHEAVLSETLTDCFGNSWKTIGFLSKQLNNGALLKVASEIGISLKEMEDELFSVPRIALKMATREVEGIIRRMR
jgi:hypothetical protein